MITAMGDVMRREKLGFPMGNGIGAVHWQRDYKGDTKVTWYET